MRVAINGFGRIGRSLTRAWLQAAAGGGWADEKLELVAVNDLAPPETLAHLLRYDSVSGALDATVEVEDGALFIDGKRVAVSAQRDPSQLPWRELGVDLVVEATGAFTGAGRARAHLDAGARKVVVSAPASGVDLTVAYGINSDAYDPAVHDVISTASCTTNCLAPLALVLHRAIGIEHGVMTTVHAYTQDQNLQDGPHTDLRRARAAAQNIVPTSSGAAKAIGQVLPELDDLLSGFALRVPVITGSITDLTVTASRDTSVEEIVTAYREAAAGPLGAILTASDAPLVSTDIVGNPASCIVDLPLTTVVRRTVKVLGWYDNEWGFSSRLLDTVRLVARS